MCIYMILIIMIIVPPPFGTPLASARPAAAAARFGGT